jgi:hypothetical protein
MEKFLDKCFKNEAHKKPVYFNSTKTLRFETEPQFLYSYEEIICEITNDGTILLFNKTASSGNFFSMTTSNHISKIKNYLEMNDIEFEFLNNF